MNTGSQFYSSHGARHLPVLLDETVKALRPHGGGRYLDGTLGLGGHAYGIMAYAAKSGIGDSERVVKEDVPFPQYEGNGAIENAELCGIDRDAEALEEARSRLAAFGDHVHFFHRRYSEFEGVLDALGWDTVDGVLLDIGVSSLQLDNAERGFSFLSDGPIDMRMDNESGEASASFLVNHAPFAKLKDIISTYGEDPQAGRIARAIVDARSKKPLQSTTELAAIIKEAYPVAWRNNARHHPATRTFQALRMAVNDELGELERFLDSILSRLAPHGRLAIISFHSLEDRIVKNKMRSWTKASPDCLCFPEVKIITVKPIVASAEEQARNSRSRSAKLRVAEKLPESERILPQSGLERYKMKKALRRERQAQRHQEKA